MNFIYVYNVCRLFSLLLTYSGHLIEFCPITNMLHFPKMPNNDELLIDELVIMECNENDIELLVLIKLSEKRQERCIKFVEYPCKQILYLTHFFFHHFYKIFNNF